MKIARQALDELLAHARESDPRECCGVLLGVGDRIATASRARNLLESETEYVIDPRDHIAARRQARAAHQAVLGFYHSHPRTAPYPSASDLAEWSYSDAVSVIVGRDEHRLRARAYRIVSGAVEEVLLEIDCD